MLDSLDPMAMEIMLSGFEVVLGSSASLRALRGCEDVPAGVAGTAAAAGTGANATLGPAAAALKASVNRTVARMSKVNNPIFFKYSSSSEFRLGRHRCEFNCHGYYYRYSKGAPDTRTV